MISLNRHYEFMGVRVSPLTMAELNDCIAEAAMGRIRTIVANHNLHSVYLVQRDERLGQFYESADLIHIDGMALVAVGRLLGFDLRREHRTTYVDWTEPLVQMATERGFRVFYLGGAPSIAEAAADRLRSAYPGLELSTADGYFDATPGSHENEERLARIQAFDPHILMVGMSMPRQERWILDNLDRLPGCAILSCGAAFDYVAGAVPTPSRAASRLGLEWLWRLAAEPRRLWRRYLVEPWSLLFLVVRDLVRIRILKVHPRV